MYGGRQKFRPVDTFHPTDCRVRAIDDYAHTCAQYAITHADTVPDGWRRMHTVPLSLE